MGPEGPHVMLRGPMGFRKGLIPAARLLVTLTQAVFAWLIRCLPLASEKEKPTPHAVQGSPPLMLLPPDCTRPLLPALTVTFASTIPVAGETRTKQTESLTLKDRTFRRGSQATDT